MPILLLCFLLTGLAGFSYFLYTRATMVFHFCVNPFVARTHQADVQKLLSEEEHEFLHDKVNSFRFKTQIISYLVLLSIALSTILVGYRLYGIDATAIGIVLAFLYASIIVNYNMSGKMVNWMEVVEDNLLTRLAQEDPDAQEAKSLDAFLETKALKQYFGVDKEIALFIDDTNELFNSTLLELGYDPNKDYFSDLESEAEFFRLYDKAEKIVQEKTAELRKESEKSSPNIAEPPEK